MELVSVIVPVYNGEKYLRECIDSVLASTYQNLEIILINDGSKDNSSVICDLYAQKNENIKVIHQQNMGIVSARNAGLEIAQGEFIAFVDSDDVISPLLYQKMVSVINYENADIVACEYCRKKEDLVVTESEHNSRYYVYKSFDEQLAVLSCAPSIREYTWTGPFVWNKLYRKAKMTASFRKECLMCEDLRFNWDYIRVSSKMVVIPEKMYYYRLNEESITGVYVNKKYDEVNIVNGISHATLWTLIAGSSPVASPQLQEYLEGRAAYFAHSALWRIYCAKVNSKYPDFVFMSKKLIHDHTNKILRDKQTYDLKLRYVIGVCRYCFPIWKIAAKSYAVLHKKKLAVKGC